jgi:predicted nucleic acid-binding protein
VVELAADIKKAAIRLRRQNKLKLPDAIIVASAMVLDAELLTNDAQLLQSPSIRSRALQLKF